MLKTERVKQIFLKSNQVEGPSMPADKAANISLLGLQSTYKTNQVPERTVVCAEYMHILKALGRYGKIFRKGTLNHRWA